MNKIKILLFLISLGLAGFSLSKTISDVYEKSRRVNELKSDIAKLEEENKKLNEEFAYKSTDEFIEKEAREKLFMGFIGERILIIPQNFFENLKKEGSKSLDVLGEKSEKPIYKQWLELITRL